LNTGLFKKIKRFALKNADFVTVNSNDTENLCSKIYDRDYIVIPMGIDTEHFKKRPIIPKNKTIKLVFVGRFTAEKGIDNLIKIIDGLREYKINFTLEIIGDGEKKNNLETFIKKRDLYEKVILPGWLPREKLIQSLYSADIFMSTSKREAQGVAIIEALSCGVPVISTDVGGVSDVLIDGFNGYLVENNNMDDFIKKIKSLNDNRELLKKLSKNASYNIHKKYSWTSIGANFEKLLN
jgi:glycosyltransferase involved in cell wall biosynthesis